MYKNWKMAKAILNPIQFDEESERKAKEAQEEYTKVAEWCNENQEYCIEDIEDYYITVKNPEPNEKDILYAELNQLKHYLDSTDYITAKMIEVIDNHDKFIEIKEYYHDELEKRELTRIKIREIKKELEEK